MKRLVIACMLLLGLCAKAQEQAPLIAPDDSIRSLLGHISPNADPHLSSHMNLQFCTAGMANFTEGALDDAAFNLYRVKLEILGSFSEDFSYHFRQSFNKYSNPHSLDNLSSSIEYAVVNWKMNDRFTLSAGKQDWVLGGYEYYVNAIKVREYSEFNDYVPCYQAGLTGRLNLSDTQELVLQVANLRGGSDADTYLYGRPSDIEQAKVPVLSTLNWNGYFADKAVQLRYAASWGQQAKGRNICYLTAGNIYEKGPVVAYLDLMYSREGLDSKGIVSNLQGESVGNPVTAQHVEYFSAIANFDYRIHPNWNVYVKGAYETSRVYKSNGPFEKGHYRTAWSGQACVEYFPMRNSELLIFAHLLYKGYSLSRRAEAVGGFCPDKQRFSIGLVYSIPVF
ncbi:MAG: OprO/OprP family phosphate-selective porin [Bacteroides sp.]|nr:OprO/OprP family phosphate-selective porin [Bacteroides sp.]